MSAPIDGKSYSIAYDVRPGYLHAHVSGAAQTNELIRAYWNEIAQECARHKIKKLLVEDALTRRVDSMSEVYKSSAEVSVIADLAGVKVAFVDRDPDHRDLNLFGELVASNRGLYCKVFVDTDEGEKWLLSKTTNRD